MQNLCRHCRTGAQLLCHQGPRPYALSAFPSVKIHGHRMAVGGDRLSHPSLKHQTLKFSKRKKGQASPIWRKQEKYFLAGCVLHNCEGENNFFNRFRPVYSLLCSSTRFWKEVVSPVRGTTSNKHFSRNHQ